MLTSTNWQRQCFIKQMQKIKKLDSSAIIALLVDGAVIRSTKFPSHLLVCAMRKLFSGTCGQRRPRSDCASAQSDQGLHCPVTESLDIIGCI